jgi:hypothetical protein
MRHRGRRVEQASLPRIEATGRAFWFHGHGLIWLSISFLDWHESFAAGEHRTDHSGPGKPFACEAGAYKNRVS